MYGKIFCFLILSLLVIPAWAMDESGAAGSLLTNEHVLQIHSLFGIGLAVEHNHKYSAAYELARAIAYKQARECVIVKKCVDILARNKKLPSELQKELDVVVVEAACRRRRALSSAEQQKLDNALARSAFCPKYAVMQELLQRGADPNHANGIGLEIVCASSCNPSLPALWLAYGANPRFGGALVFANNGDVVKLLVRSGAPIDCCETMGGGGAYFLPVTFKMARNADFDTLVWLLHHGADPNVWSRTEGYTLIYSVLEGENALDSVVALLYYGARFYQACYDHESCRSKTSLEKAQEIDKSMRQAQPWHAVYELLTALTELKRKGELAHFNLRDVHSSAEYISLGISHGSAKLIQASVAAVVKAGVRADDEDRAYEGECGTST